MPPPRPLPGTVTSLSDQELVDQLRQYNVSPGPILPTTRRVYQRKLFELQTGQQAAPSSNYEPVDDDESEDEADQDSVDEEVTFQEQHQPRQRTTKSIRTEVRKPSPRKPLHGEFGDRSGSRVPSSLRNTPAASAQNPPAAPGGGFPLWLKLLIIVIVATIVFLVIKNMESEPVSDIPEQIEVNV